MLGQHIAALITNTGRCWAHLHCCLWWHICVHMRSGQRIHQALYPRQEGVHWQLDGGVRHKSIVLGRDQQRCLQAKAQRQ